MKNSMSRALWATTSGFLVVGAVVVGGSAPVSAAGYPQSSSIAMVPDGGGRYNSGGALPTSGFPDGYAPTFTNVPVESIRDGLDDPLEGFDTVVLNSVCDIDAFLSDAQFKSRLEGFVSAGGKLLIWDSECTATDYSKFSVPFQTSNPGAAGAQGTLVDVEENTLSSQDPSSPNYVNVGAVASGTDAVGDANVFTTFDPRWFSDLRATNVLGVDGPVQAYANLGSGLVIYSGFDKDFLPGGSFDAAAQDGASHLNRIWLLELLQPWDPDGLPNSSPVVGAGKDADADGLPDDWEESGYRAEAGLILVDLPGMGADPNHKDIFVVLDAEKSASFSKKAEEIVVRAFKESPVGNPDGANGINLHLIRWDQAMSAATSDALKRTNADGSVDPDFEKIFERLAPGWASVAHYAISVNWTHTAWSGKSDDIPGQLFVLNTCGASRAAFYLKDKGFPVGWGCNASDAQQATTFMHELGHNLDLRHGGSDDVPYKPNYLSVMNYTFSDPKLGHFGVPGIGVTYSSWGEEVLYALDENSLAEADGVRSRPGTSLPPGIKTYYFCQDSGQQRELRVASPADWDCYKGAGRGRVSADINYPKSARGDAAWTFLAQKRELVPFDDWRHIQESPAAFRGGSIGRTTAVWTPGVPIA